MKLKGINPFEQNLEKLVLALVALAFIGVLAMQFLLKPNDVEVAAGKKVSPDAIFVDLERQAQELKSRISDPSPALPEVPAASLGDQYEQLIKKPVAPSSTLASSFGLAQQGVAVVGGSNLPTDGDPGAVDAFTGLSVPMTGTPVAVGRWCTIDPYELAENPNLARFIPSSQPYDMPSVSVQVSFDGKALEEALTGKGEGGGRSIPRKFWSQSGLVLMDVGVERQAKRADGSWADAEAVTRIKGSTQEPATIESGASLADFAAAVRQRQSELDAIARPAFPPTISGLPWTPPVEAAELAKSRGGSGEVARLTKAIERLEQEIVDVKAGKSGRTTSRPSNTRTGKPGSTTTRTNTGTTDSKQRRIDAQVKRREKEIQRHQDRLQELGVQVDSGGQDKQQSSGSSTDSGDALLGAEDFQVWTHDFGVEPGTEYRYRMRIGVNNPLYGRASVIDPDDAQQQDMGSQPIAYGPWSAWSESALVGANDYFFVSSASDRGQLTSSPRASVELYTMYFGYYRKATLSMEPGDTVMGIAKVGPGFYLFDPGLLDFNGAKRAVDERLKLLGVDDPGGQPARGSGPGNEPDSIGGLQSAPDELSVSLGYTLLDVVLLPIVDEEVPGSRRSPIEVLLRAPDGRVEVRRIDPGDAAYAMVSSVASAGEDATMSFDGERTARKTGGPGQPGTPAYQPPSRDDRPGGGKRPARP